MKAALLAAALAAIALPVAAQSSSPPLWELGLGAGALSLPHYRGSDERHTWLLPVPYLVYRGRILKADREGARAVLFDSERVDVDLSLGASTPTRSNGDEARSGMPDLKPTVEVGPSLNYALAGGPGWKLGLRAPLRAAITVERNPRAIGWITNPGALLELSDIAGWNVNLRGSLLWSDRRFNAHYYEVTPAQATATRPAYEARAGYGGTQWTASLSRRFDNHWIGAFVRYDSLAGATYADSPLVRERNQWSAGIAFAWVFARSSQPARGSD